MNYSNQMESFRSRFEQALNRPIQNRCAELTVLIDRGNMNDLQQMFPLLIDNIFRPNGGFSNWQLRNLTNTGYSQDFQALQHFFSPTGPMFKLIYQLLTDPNIKFPFSLSFLPAKVMYSAVGPNKHPFYIDLIHTDAQTNQVISLMLNPFDYYIFHFAYHLINPRNQLIPGAWNTLYYMLCCDYILHFLPPEPSKVINPPLDYYNGKNPTYTLPCFNQSPISSRLLRSDMVNVQRSSSHENHSRNKIWRSETIITVFIDFWLNNDQVVNSGQHFDNYLYMQQKQFKVNELPTGEYIRIVRVLVKQLHSFGSSLLSDDTPMGELKKIVIPYLQGRMYVFLRHLMHQWPLDGSFRLVLELWLTFLQPWRYPGALYKRSVYITEPNVDVDDLSTAPTKAIDPAYKNFIADNLLCYTVLAQQLIPRFTRVDLSSPRLALILFRMLKVFAQPNLVNYLREFEASVGCLTTSPMHSFNNSTSNQTSLPPLSPTMSWSTNVTEQHRTAKQQSQQAYYASKSNGFNSSGIKQKIMEYEGTGFAYKPIFNAPAASEVYQLYHHIKNCMETATIFYEKQRDSKKFGFSINDILKSMFMSPETNIDEFTLEERKQVPIWLKSCYKCLETMFCIEAQQATQHSDFHLDTSRDISSKQVASPTSQSKKSFGLRPVEVRQRVLQHKFDGNPDLVSIRSDEVEILVKLLYELAMKINNRWSLKLTTLYHEETFAGQLTRQLVAPPCKIYKYVKSNCEVSRVSEELPARFNFRYFASYKFLTYLVVAILLSYVCGFSIFGFPVGILCLWFLNVCIKAAIHSCRRDNGQANAVVNESLNASMFSTSNDSFN